MCKYRDMSRYGVVYNKYRSFNFSLYLLLTIRLLRFLFRLFLLSFLLLSLLSPCIHQFYNLQHNRLIRTYTIPNLIYNFDNIFILVLWLQHHNITSGTINKFIIGWLHICHYITFISIHPTHY